MTLDTEKEHPFPLKKNFIRREKTAKLNRATEEESFFYM